MCIVHAMNFQRIVCVLPEYQHHFTPDDDVGMLAPHWNDMPYFKYIFKPLTNEHWFLSISHTIFLFLFLSLCINWNCKLLIWTTLLSLYSRWCQLVPIAILMCVCVYVYTLDDRKLCNMNKTIWHWTSEMMTIFWSIFMQTGNIFNW